MHRHHHFAQVNWEGVAFVRHKTETVLEGHFVQKYTCVVLVCSNFLAVVFSDGVHKNKQTGGFFEQNLTVLF